MANEVIVIYPDGERHIVCIDNITDKELTYPLRCAGILSDGTTCGIPMRPFLGENSRRNGYFYEASRSSPHKPECPYCKGRKKITVEQLDRRASGETRESIYNSINNKKKSRNPTQTKKEFSEPENPIDTNIDTQEPTRRDDAHKEITIRPRKPHNLEEYYSLLSALKVSDHYADSLVFDLILDERTVESYRPFSLPTNRPFVVVAKRTLPYAHNIQLNPNQWLLVDYWSRGNYGYRPFVFLLNVTNEAKNKLQNLCQIEPSVKICIYSVFSKHKYIDGMYESDLVDTHNIYAVF